MLSTITNNDHQTVTVLSFIDEAGNEEVKRFLVSLGIHYTLKCGHRWLENYHREQIKGVSLVLMPNDGQLLRIALMPVVKMTDERLAVVFFDGMPAFDLSHVIHFDSIYEWPGCQDMLRDQIHTRVALTPEKANAGLREKKQSPALAVMKRVAHSDASCLILGEEGTCKTHLGKRLHKMSLRTSCPFVSVRCSIFNDENFQQVLFGKTSGLAGTMTGGTNELQKGLVQRAEKGSLFLNDIHKLSLRNQFRLHRFLSDFRYRPMGASRFYLADVRILCGADEALEQAVLEGRFRKDLFEKINVFRIRTTPLRESKNKIPKLVEQMCERFAKYYQLDKVQLESDDIDWALEYQWPGNVVELEQFIHSRVSQMAGLGKHVREGGAFDGIPILNEAVHSEDDVAIM